MIDIVCDVCGDHLVVAYAQPVLTLNLAASNVRGSAATVVSVEVCPGRHTDRAIMVALIRKISQTQDTERAKVAEHDSQAGHK